MKHPPILSCAIMAAFVGMAATVSAQSVWTGEGTDNNWNNPLNWEGNTNPTDGQLLYFGIADSYTVDRNVATTTSPRPHQIIFNKDAGAYTFIGNRIQIITAGGRVTNNSGKLQTFTSGLTANNWNAGHFYTYQGDILVQSGYTGSGYLVKNGVGTLTIEGTNSNAASRVAIHAGTLVVDDLQGLGGSGQGVTFHAANTSALEITGAASGVTEVSKSDLRFEAGQGAAARLTLDSNGGDGIELSFTSNSDDALIWFGASSGASFNLDLSSHVDNSVSFQSRHNNAAFTEAGIWGWATVTEKEGAGQRTGFGTLSGTNMVAQQNSALTVFDGTQATSRSTGVLVTGDATLASARSVGNMTINSATAGAMTGEDLTLGGLLMQEGSASYTIDNNLLHYTNGVNQEQYRIYLHQYSTDGDLTLNGLIHTPAVPPSPGTGYLVKTGPGTVIIGNEGRVLTPFNTLIQEGRFVLNGEIERSAEVRVFHTATLSGDGAIGTQAASAVRIYAGGTVEGSTAASLDVTGTLSLESWSHFAFTLDYGVETLDRQFMDVSGLITLSDDVNLQLTLTSAPVSEERVYLLSGGSGITGDFATINGGQFGPDGAFTLTWNEQTYDFFYFNEGGDIWVQYTPTVIPEPSSIALIGFGLGALLFRYRRSRQAA